MSLKKGINRIGTVAGAAAGLFFGSLFCFDSYRGLGGFQNSDIRIVLSSVAIGFVVFLVTFFAIKGIFKAANWIIEGFRG